jgi:hypothetical protein
MPEIVNPHVAELGLLQHPLEHVTGYNDFRFKKLQIVKTVTTADDGTIATKNRLETTDDTMEPPDARLDSEHPRPRTAGRRCLRNVRHRARALRGFARLEAAAKRKRKKEDHQRRKVNS